MDILVPGTSGLSDTLIIVLPSTTPAAPFSSPTSYLNLYPSTSNGPLQVQANQQLTLRSNPVMDQLNLIKANLIVTNSNYLSGVNNQQHIQLPLATQPVLVPSALVTPNPLQNVQLSVFPELSNLSAFDLNTDHIPIGSTAPVSSANGVRLCRASQRISSTPNSGIVSPPKTMCAAVQERVCGTQRNVVGEETSESAQRVFMRSAGNSMGSRSNTMTVPTVPRSDSINDSIHSNSNLSTISNDSKVRNGSLAHYGSTNITAINSDGDKSGDRGVSNGFSCPHCNARYDIHINLTSAI